MGVKFGLDVEKGSEETLKEDVREGWELGVGRRRGGERTVSVKCKEESEWENLTKLEGVRLLR